MIRRLWNAFMAAVAAGTVVFAAWWVLSAKTSPLPGHWNPIAPLDATAPVTWVTPLKLGRAAAEPEACFATLAAVAEFERMEPLVTDGPCGIDPRLRLSRVGDTAVTPFETTCAIALRMALWERNVVQPAARDHLGSPVARLSHQSSYNCRAIRTPGGPGSRLSTHATAQSVDISGVVLADGRRLTLAEGWDGTPSESRFFRALRDGACDWFVTVLGPEYNALHADHFHLQSVGGGLCR